MIWAHYRNLGIRGLLIITYLTHCYIWQPVWSLSLKCMRTCFLLGWVNVTVVTYFDGQAVGCTNGFWETGAPFPAFFGSLIVIKSAHYYSTKGINGELWSQYTAPSELKVFIHSFHHTKRRKHMPKRNCHMFTVILIKKRKFSIYESHLEGLENPKRDLRYKERQ